MEFPKKSNESEEDEVRKLVKEEGRSARNLLTYNVPLNVENKTYGDDVKNKPITPNFKPREDISEKCNSPRKMRIRSASAGRNPKWDLHARHWAFLFENLNRAVDEIYNTCETDESVVECKEVIMMLENFAKDFTALIDWIHLKKDYENSSILRRPAFVAWEIRKSSPSKHRPRRILLDGESHRKVARFLNFDEKKFAILTTATIAVQTESVNTLNSLPETNITRDATENKTSSVTTTSNKTTTLTNSWTSTTVVKRTPSVSREVKTNDKRNERKMGKNNDTKTKVINKNVANLKEDLINPSWADKVRGNDVASDDLDVKNDNKLDNDGWEIVHRNKFRSRNSPPHKTLIQNQQLNNKNRAGSVPLETPKNGKIISDGSNIRENKLNLVHSLPSLNLLEDVKDIESFGKISEDKDKDKGSDEDETKPIDDVNKILDKGSDEDETKPIDDALESAIQEEESLNKQIEEAKNSTLEDNVEFSEDSITPILDLDLHLIHQETEERLGHQLSALSWGDRMDEIEADLRLPGHALHMHEKLSSPSRKRSLTESIRRHEEKQAKAQEQRERLLEFKAQKLRDLSKKVEEVRSLKDELLVKRKHIMEHKLQKAQEKRHLQLQKIKRKAHDEEEKVNEIAFINSLEAQNKRHDVLTKIQGHEARLQDIHGERQRKQEEKAAKEAAAEERRRALEAERQARLAEIQEKRKIKQIKIEQQQQEKEKERLEQAREKARDREERLTALYAAQQATVEVLQKKIQQKQEESARRHEENMEQIRQKALELSILRYSSSTDDAPQIVPYETKKMCTTCNVLIGSEMNLLSHLRGKKHQQTVKEQNAGRELSREELEKYNLKHIVNAPADKMDAQLKEEKERQKTLKKKSKKLRQRMNAKGLEYEKKMTNETNQVPQGSKLVKLLKDLDKSVQRQNNVKLATSVVTTLDRTMNEIVKHLDKGVDGDLDLFRTCGGFNILSRAWDYLSPAQTPQLRSLVIVCSILHRVCRHNFENCCYVLLSNRISSLLDLLLARLNMLIHDARAAGDAALPPSDAVGSAAAQVIVVAFEGVKENGGDFNNDVLNLRLHDVVSYVVSVGLVDAVCEYFHLVHGPVNQQHSMLLRCMDFVTALTKLHLDRGVNFDVFADAKPPSDTGSAQLEAAYRATGLVGAVSLLYGVLLHSGAPSRAEHNPPPQLPSPTLALVTSGLRMLNYMALVHLTVFQAVLADDALSLEFRHIASYLLWYHSKWNNETELIHELILTVGYFTVLNNDHQMIIHAGHPPTLLQQLTSLPFNYFSDPALIGVLYPTLVACCHQNQTNKMILQQEMTSELLARFIQDNEKDGDNSDVIDNGDPNWRWRLVVRFPRHRWNEAISFFNV